MKRIIALLILLPLMTSNTHAMDKKMYVVNALGETISIIDLATGIVTNDVVAVGLAPNDVRINGNYAYVINSLSSDISVIGLLNNNLETTIQLPLDSNPWALIFDGAGGAYVSNSGLNSLSLLDLSTNTVTGGIITGTWPEGMLITGGYLYTTATGFDINTYGYSQGIVHLIDTQIDTIIADIEVPMNPQVMAIGPDSLIYVMCTGNYFSEFGKIAIIDPDGGVGGMPVVIDTVAIGGMPGDIGITSEGKMFIAAGGGWLPGDDGYVFLYDITADSIIHGESNPLITAASASRIVIDEETNSVYVSCFADDIIQKLDKTTGAVLMSYEVGDGPQAMAIGYDITTNISDGHYGIVKSFELHQNYPNPFNPETAISFQLKYAGNVRLTVYNVMGQVVETLINENYPAGLFSVTFDGSNLATGVYLYRVATEHGTVTRKMILVR